MGLGIRVLGLGLWALGDFFGCAAVVVKACVGRWLWVLHGCDIAFLLQVAIEILRTCAPRPLNQEHYLNLGFVNPKEVVETS